MWSSFAARHPRLVTLGGWVLLALPVLWFVRALLAQPSAVGDFGDIRTFHFFWDVARRTVLDFGQAPFWNPYYCGGMVEWANAETMMLAPTFLASLLFGAGVGLRAHFILHFVLGFYGCWVLARQRGLRPAWALAVGVVFVFSGNFAERATGHPAFMPFLLLPWLAYFYDRARAEARWAAPLALLIAYCVFAGAPYTFIFFMLYVALLVAWDTGGALIAWRRGDSTLAAAARPTLLGAAVAVLVALVIAVKGMPVSDFMEDFPRLVPEKDYLAKWQVWEMFLRRDMSRERKGYYYVFGEYRQYLGLAMVAVPLMLLRVRQHARDYFMLGVLCLLMLGSFAAWAPYALMQALPVFDSLRVPARYALLMDLHIALLFAAMLQRAHELAGELPWPRLRRPAVVALGLFFAAVAWDLTSVNNRQLKGFYHVSPDAEPRDGPFRMVHGKPGLVFHGPQRNEGHLRCYAPNPLRISPHVKADLPSEVYLGEGQGSAAISAWSPNEIVVQATAETPAVLTLNMNHHRDWRADGAEVIAWRGLVAARVPAGEHRVRFWYRPRRFGLYLALTLVGLAACAVVWRRGAR